MATSTIPLQNDVYKAGDVFSPRSWRAIGRVINSGKGLYCWFSMGKPVVASSMTLSIGIANVFGIGSSYTLAGTISSVSISGNTIMFVLDTTTTHTAGQLAVIEFTNTSMTLT